MAEDVKQRIDELVKNNGVVLFMKGDRDFPQCGFSMRAVQLVNALGVPYTTFNVLEDWEVRQGIKEYSEWPTIPQLYIKGEFVGGSDVCMELFQQGELQKLVQGL